VVFSHHEHMHISIVVFMRPDFRGYITLFINRRVSVVELLAQEEKAIFRRSTRYDETLLSLHDIYGIRRWTMRRRDDL